MARKQTPTLTVAELKLMRIIWEHDESTVSDVMEKLPKESNLAYNTVLTTLRILEQKGYLNHFKKGRAHVFSSVVTKSQARTTALRQMVSSFFNDSPELLLLSLIESEDVTSEDIDKLKRMIKDGEEN